MGALGLIKNESTFEALNHAIQYEKSFNIYIYIKELSNYYASSTEELAHYFERITFIIN